MSADASGETLRVMLARLEGKVDAALAVQGARVEEHAVDLKDHEARLRVVESKPTVSPRLLWTGLVSAVLAVSAASPLLDRFYS